LRGKKKRLKLHNGVFGGSRRLRDRDRRLQEVFSVALASTQHSGKFLDLSLSLSISPSPSRSNPFLISFFFSQTNGLGICFFIKNGYVSRFVFNFWVFIFIF